MKKYEVALILASTGSSKKLALARMILDMMEPKELYEEVGNVSAEEIKRMSEDEIFELLGIDFTERSERLEDDFVLKNYDVALAMAVAGMMNRAREIMESIDPKKDLRPSNFDGVSKENRLHDELFKWLKNNNIPQQDIPNEKKYYFREIAVGWRTLGMEIDLKKELGDFIEDALKGIDDKIANLLRKEIELNFVDRGLFDKVLKKSLAERYPVIKLNLLKFIDYVCVIGDTAWIIEGKRVLNYEAVGQVNVYSYLFSKDYPNFSVKKAIVCKESDPLIEEYCRKSDIRVFVMN